MNMRRKQYWVKFKLKHLLQISFIGLVLSLTSCGGGSSSTSATPTPVANNAVVQLAGVVVVPNLGVVQNATVTVTDLVTNKVVGTSATKKTNGTYFIPTTTKNPVILSVTSGQYLDEYTGANVPIPTNGIRACIPAVSSTVVTITPITEIATRAALLRAKNNPNNPLATIIDQANKDVGSALLNGADPTTTIPVDISKATPVSATQDQKNYARLLAGLASDAAINSGADLYTAAQTLTNALFDSYGTPILSTGGAVPVSIQNLQTEVSNYTPVGTISANNVPALDPYAVVGIVNPALASGSSKQDYFYMEVYLDPYSTVLASQESLSTVEMGVETVDTSKGNSSWGALYGSSNGVAIANASLNKGTNILRVDPNGRFLFNSPASPNATPNKYEFSKDGQFAVGRNIGDTGAMAARLNFVVKKPTVAPTLSSVAGTYHIALLAHDSSVTPRAMAGYTEHGTLVLDGKGNLTYKAVNTSTATGMPVRTTVASTNTYSVDPYGVVLNTAGNGHILFSQNGQYGLYELHAGTTQEWGILIKDHKTTVPFSKLTTAKVYDTHYQGNNLGNVFYFGLNVANWSPVVGSPDGMQTDVRKGFSPLAFAPNLICGTTTTGTCFKSGLAGDKAYIPANPADGANAVNGNFFLYPNGSTVPAAPQLKFSAYTSQNGDVFWIDDEGWAIVIGTGR